MEFGKHLGKGLWGIADKALPVVYGISYVLLVIRVLAEEEFGNFVLIQEIFLILSNLAAAFALHPLLKFAAETKKDHRDVIGASLILNIGFVLACSVLVVAVRAPFAALLKAPALEGLMPYVAGMLAANLIRNFTLILLQTRFHVQQVFWIDAAHFLGAPILILVYSWMHIFNSAFDLIIINIMSLSFSSVIGLWLAWPMLKFTLKPRREEMQRTWDYGKYSFFTIVSYMFYIKSDSFIHSAFGGPVQVAVYNSVKVFIRIYDMVAQVVQMFVFPAVSRLSSQGEYVTLKNLLEKAIAFTTIALIPVFIIFLFLSPPIVGFIYHERYTEAIPLLQIFAVLCLVAPVTAVASNTLLGLGHARLSFVLGAKTLVGSLIVYMVLIPWLGPLGATIGYVVSSCIQAWLFTMASNRYVPVSFRGILCRTDDIVVFVRSRMTKS